MGRKLFLLVQIALLSVLVFWLFKNPGQMTIHWFGLRLEMEVSTFVLAALMALVFIGLLFAVMRRIFKIPARLFQSYTALGENKAVKSLYEAVQSYFCQDYEGALTHLQKATPLVKEKALCQFLEAHCHLRLGHTLKAEHLFYALSTQLDTQKGGLMGLFDSAVQNKDQVHLWEYTQALYPLLPTHPQVLKVYYEEALARGEGTRALKALAQRERLGLVGPQEIRTLKGQVFLAQARALIQSDNGSGALQAATQAFEIWPTRETLDTLTRLLRAQDHPKRAARALRSFLSQTFDSEFFEELVRLEGVNTPAARFGLLEELVGEASKAPLQSLQALVKEGLQCHLWGQTQHYLALYARRNGEDAFFFTACARLALDESGDTKSALSAYQKALRDVL